MGGLDSRNIVVVGAGGFLGSSFANWAERKGWGVLGIDLECGSRLDKKIPFRRVDCLDYNGVLAAIREGDSVLGEISGAISFASRDYKIEKVSEGSGDYSKVALASTDDFDLSINGGISLYNACVEYSDGRGFSLVLTGSDLSVIAPYQELYRELYGETAVKPASYSAVKHGMLGLVKYLATFSKTGNIRCNLLCPSGVDNGTMDKGFKDRLASLNPMNRLSTLDEMCGAAGFLLSTDSGFVNGQALLIDGGRSIW